MIINEMVSDDGPVPMDLEYVGTHDARTTQSGQDANNDMSYDCVCDCMERIQGWQRSRQERTERSRNAVSWRKS